MIKFKMFLKIWEGDRCKFEEVLEKCQNISFFSYFLGHFRDGPLFSPGVSRLGKKLSA